LSNQKKIGTRRREKKKGKKEEKKKKKQKKQKQKLPILHTSNYTILVRYITKPPRYDGI